jgi:hypothetical protein
MVDKVWMIEKQPKKQFELRVVVWECYDVPMMDVEDCVDIYIEGRK